jgi:hypothetical protein
MSRDIPAELHTSSCLTLITDKLRNFFQIQFNSLFIILVTTLLLPM